MLYLIIFLQKEPSGEQYLYVKPELGLLYPGAEYVSEIIKKEYNKNNKLPIVLDCMNIKRLDYSAAKVSKHALEIKLLLLMSFC